MSNVAPTIRGIQTTNDNSTTSVSTYDASWASTGAVAGDTITVETSQHFNTPVLGLPSGWSWLYNPAGVSGNVIRSMTKVLSSADITAGKVTLTWTGGNVMSVAIATVYVGAVTFGTPVFNSNVSTALSVTMTTSTGLLRSNMSTTHATLEPGTVAYATGTAESTARTTRSGSNVRLTTNGKAAPGTGSQTAGAVTVTGNAAATLQGAAYEVIGPSSIDTAPTAISSGEAFGTAVVSNAAVSMAPTAISSVQAFGTSVMSGSVSLSPSGVATQEAFGTTSAAGVSLLSPTAIATATAVGTPTASASTTMSPTAIASGELFGTEALSGSVLMSPSGVVTLESVNQPDVGGQPQGYHAIQFGDGLTSSQTSVVLSWSAFSPSVGDCAIIAVFGGFNGNTITPPSGWSVLSGPDDSTTGNRGYLFKKDLDSSDVSAGSVTFTWSGPARTASVGVVISGAQLVGAVSHNSLVATAPSVNTLYDNSYVLLMADNTIASGQPNLLSFVDAFPTKDVQSRSNIASGANTGAALGHISTGAKGTYGGGTITGASGSATYQAYAIEVVDLATLPSSGRSPGVVNSSAVTRASSW